jgi:hypothetical protein
VRPPERVDRHRGLEYNLDADPLLEEIHMTNKDAARVSRTAVRLYYRPG